MLAVVLAALIVGDGPKEDQLRTLEGVWAAERMEQKGKKFPTDLVVRVRLEVRGDRFTFINGQTEFISKITQFDPFGKPRAIDLTRDVDKQTVLGIYKLEDDTLTVCTSTRGVRPSAFETDPQSPNVLTVYRRVALRP
ncbi:MAG TPA: TIGR03067 domain-containing protein [Isosphaeraceae bacterium]|jgi:uncharacterized protein (TIGR03067 family)